MRGMMIVVVTGILLSLAGPAFPAVFQRDWKTAGDGLLTYDDVNEREWLDIPVSLMTHFSGATLETRFQDAVLELQPGGQFDGFTLASQGDVFALAQSAGIDTSTDDYNTNHVAAAELLDLMGRTVVLAPGSAASGLLSNAVPPPPLKCPCHLVATILVGVQETYPAGMSFAFSSEIGLDDGGIRTTGLVLYRQVPEPSALLLATLGFFTFAVLPRFR